MKTIGFVGQGFIGKNYANDFDSRGISVVRYSLEAEYVGNKDKIKDCDIVFIAVTALTVPSGELRDDGHPKVKFDDSNIREAITLTRSGAVVVIKSTIPPGSTVKYQEAYPDRTIFHSPEFLTETTAAHDAAHPERNIIGIPTDTPEARAKAEEVLALFPKAPFTLICSAQDAEFIKYGSNAFLFLKIVFANMLYELVEKYDGDWETIRAGIGADPRVGSSHLGLRLKDDPPHLLRRRGAGRSCFIKDFALLSELYAKDFPQDTSTIAAMRGFEYKNSQLLRDFDRYVHLLEGVYGKGAGIK